MTGEKFDEEARPFVIDAEIALDKHLEEQEIKTDKSDILTPIFLGIGIVLVAIGLVKPYFGSKQKIVNENTPVVTQQKVDRSDLPSVQQEVFGKG